MFRRSTRRNAGFAILIAGLGIGDEAEPERLSGVPVSEHFLAQEMI